jgi:glyoxylase-like metal-dependent hydrolase (beta-lactamase superfamily II)
LMFLTHRDDVADHEKFHKRFGCKRILHAGDITASTRKIEMPITGEQPVSLDADCLLIPTPGHTKGSMCLLYKNKFLFTGDHMAWDPDARKLIGFESACWYDWELTKKSLKKVMQYQFEWVLPGHDWPWHATTGSVGLKDLLI